ncbi:DUF1592 domain-containing protein [Luteolibacter luteus]|uniref:DUF1592 domain-containing protein n=1 Tax=Luteolibacter luteus TaxID=2728835 RepID=A0A858REC0_9BACT|nr:DUF1592 domain-containing protein [Luteolibacter luteus]QJE94904.1 DUF1592 domain-containing protein [Luteolibacter luteus]
MAATRKLHFTIAWLLACAARVSAAEAAGRFDEKIRPLLGEYCLDCHSEDEQKGDLDLERFSTLEAVMKDPAVWESVIEQIELGEMPPKKKRQPSPEQKEELLAWTRGMLGEVARRDAGDPGPVVMRRLSNAEYTWTLRDLTGVSSLDPAREFPVDGAAGEGFTNAGAALVMSPALVGKYLDAAKEVAAHAVLLPDRIEFSESTMRQDWTDAKLAAIRAIYSRYAVTGEGQALNLQGIKFDTLDGGVIPLERYFAATLEEGERLAKGEFARIAKDRGLSSKYLQSLWQVLNAETPSFPLNVISQQWKAAKQGEEVLLAATVKQWQHALWKFNTIGHIGIKDGPLSWLEAVTPVTGAQELRVKLDPKGGEDVVLKLSVSDAGDGNVGDEVLWENARITRPDSSDVALRDAVPLAKAVGGRMASELDRVNVYLAALTEVHRDGKQARQVAEARGLDPDLLERWLKFAGLGEQGTPTISGHFKDKITDVAGNPAVQALGSPETPSITVNRSAETARFSTLTVPPRSVLVHPSPSLEANVAWRSPISGKIRIKGSVADADANCGNGVAWRVELIQRNGVTGIAADLMDNGGNQAFESSECEVAEGDLVKLSIDPRDGQHICDTTRVDLSIVGGGSSWDLAKEVVDRLHKGNPLPDLAGNADVWHFCANASVGKKIEIFASGSIFAKWRDALLAGEGDEVLNSAAQAVKELLVSEVAVENVADRAFRERARDWRGPLGWLAAEAEDLHSAAGDIGAKAPSELEFRIPAQLAKGAEFVAKARVHPLRGLGGTVQVDARLARMDASPASLQPILIHESGADRPRVVEGLDEFREIFPAALCYSKIVPVDQVVTLQLFYREDDQLRRLMLDEAEVEELDRLWNELQVVSLAPLKLVDAFEQLWQYVTQGGDPSGFEPMRQPIMDGAKRFREEQVKAEPVHLQSTIDVARKAWRRPLTPAEEESLRGLYQKLRSDEIDHDETIRLLLARILTAPAFLYKVEKQGEGSKASPVSSYEMASRLSYFLWSTAPDAELLSLAKDGRLMDPEVLAAQAQRMSRDSRVRRLSTEFGAQWLHTRGLDQLDEKSETVFPEFTGIRQALNEEPIRFFTDLFQRDGSVLDLLEADHTFVNEALAKYYGIQGVSGPEWQRVDDVRKLGRGGVLGFGATLAKQSGASRTSPILRGTWVCETLLGEHLPSPPKDVPVLPEQPPANLSERELTEMHSKDPACARCHVRIDPFGFALENYDAIGRRRELDATGLPVNAKSRLANGTEFAGIDGLRAYLAGDRRSDFTRQFCRKLLGYALGRGVLLSDAPLLDAMQEELSKNDHRVGVVIRMIVRSPQFREIRGKEHPQQTLNR